MEINFPNWLTMLRVGRLTFSVDEVPKFHTAVTRSGGQIISLRMERDSSDPVLMTLTTHNEVTVGNGPELPGCVIGSSCEDILFGVV